MLEPIAFRHRMAIDLLEIGPRQRVLEIGCGHGVATGLACAAAGNGQVVAIDRSAKMTAAAGRRNADAVAEGRLLLLTGAFEDIDLDHEFDRVFAVNVDFPRHEDRGWAQRLREVMAPGGRAVLVLDAPTVATADRFVDAAGKTLAGEGFSVEVVREASVVAVLAVAPAALAGDTRHEAASRPR